MLRRRPKKKPDGLRDFLNSALKPPHRAAEDAFRAEATNEASKAYEAFMASFRGRSCAMCGKMWFLKDEKGGKIQTAGHHILLRSTHPEHKMTRENVIPLCVKCHGEAHYDDIKFRAWLHDNRLKQWLWVQTNDNHRKGE